MLIPLSLSYLSPKTNTTTSHWLVLGKKYWSRDHPLRLRICQTFQFILSCPFWNCFHVDGGVCWRKKMRGMGEQFLSGCVYAPENIPHGTHAMLHPYFCILPSNRILIRADLRIQRFFTWSSFPRCISASKTEFLSLWDSCYQLKHAACPYGNRLIIFTSFDLRKVRAYFNRVLSYNGLLFGTIFLLHRPTIWFLSLFM